MVFVRLSVTSRYCVKTAQHIALGSDKEAILGLSYRLCWNGIRLSSENRRYLDLEFYPKQKTYLQPIHTVRRDATLLSSAGLTSNGVN